MFACMCVLRGGGRGEGMNSGNDKSETLNDKQENGRVRIQKKKKTRKQKRTGTSLWAILL